jgi:hypothetical protein
MKKGILVLIFVCFISGCSENNNPLSGSPDSIYGKWEIISGNYFPYTKYLVINSDNTWHRLNADKNGFRSLESGVCKIYPAQVTFGYYKNMNYTITGNELKLTHPDYNLTAVWNPSAPGKDEWIKLTTVVDSLIPESYISWDIAFDGENIWWTGSNRLIKINTSTKVESSFPLDRSMHPIEWDGNNLWSSGPFGIGPDNLYKIDPANGNVAATYQNDSLYDIEALAFDGTYLWCHSGYNNKLYKYQPDSNKVIDQIDFIYAERSSITFAEGFLYIIDRNLIHKCTLPPLKAVAAYEIKNFNLSGIAYNNGTFWVSSRSYDGTKTVDKLFKIVLH